MAASSNSETSSTPPGSTPRSTGNQTGLTDLEANVIGLFWQLGPCSAYRVRKVFEDSPTPAWSGSTGAIYPLVRRLTTRGLLRSRRSDDRRRTRLREVTEHGMDALRRWFDAGATDETLAGAPPDTLRCHVSLLGVLAPEARVAFVVDAARQLRDSVEALEARLSESPSADRFTRWAEEGSLELARARLRWLETVRTELASDV